MVDFRPMESWENWQKLSCGECAWNLPCRITLQCVRNLIDHRTEVITSVDGYRAENVDEEAVMELLGNQDFVPDLEFDQKED